MASPGFLVTDEQNVFINTGSGLNPDSNGDDIKLSFNDVSVRCSEDEYFKLVLKSFSMYKSWPNVNAHNSKFLLRDSAGIMQLFLDERNYKSTLAMVENFASKVNAALISRGYYQSATSISFANDLDGNTNGAFNFAITCDQPHGLSGGDIELFANVEEGEIYRLLGLKRSKKRNETNGWIMIADHPGVLRFRGYYNCQTSTEAYVYLRCKSSGCSISTRNFQNGSVDAPGPQLEHSSLLARIPIQRNVLAYDSQQDEYFVNLKNTRNLSHLELSLTNSKGRRIPMIHEDQDTVGNRSFECVLGIQTIKRLGFHQHHFDSPKEDVPYTHNNTIRPLAFHKQGRTGY